MSAWRAAGLNYINFSNIAARCLRQALKPEFKADAFKRGDSHIRFTKWENGKPITTAFVAGPVSCVYRSSMRIQHPPPRQPKFKLNGSTSTF